ncbi:hypothetical protein [Sporosarcina beigongshangi]|uniref:hypothetical protein n=1 Tax=Sporosarcina beigongshangi TaxID=2782538 RepID=UPI00193A0B74|nr:hypothetical protein [Sporosarcina beigongshangi]
MKNLTIAVILRILLFITLSLYAFNLLHSGASDYLRNSNIYLALPFWIVVLIIQIREYKYSKSQTDGRFIMKDLILPELSSKDEREMELTGKAAKDALSAVLVFSPISIVLLGITMLSESTLPLLLTFLLVATIPIVGLITYYFSYRRHYLR